MTLETCHYSAEEYTRIIEELERLRDTSQNSDRVTRTVSIRGTVDSDSGISYVDLILTRGPRRMITTKAVKDPDSRFYDNPYGLIKPEDVGGYYLFSGDGEDAGGMVIRTQSPVQARNIHKEFELHLSLGYRTRDVLEYMLSRSRYAEMSSPLDPSRSLLDFRG